jgi:hypothetical protein
MFSSTIVDVAIGLMFLYFVLSLIASAASELLESFLKNRASDLERGIRELLNDPSGDGKHASGLTQTFYDHPLISGLFRGVYKPGSRTLPSYIPSRTFALALMDIVLPATNGPVPNGGTAGATVGPAAPVPQGVGALAAPAPPAVRVPPPASSFRDAIAKLPDSKIQQALLALTDAADDDANRIRENIETWFNSSMDRVSGWYKRRTHWILFEIGFAVAVLIGANSINIVTKLAADRTMREFLVTQASDEVHKPNPSDASTNQARELQLQESLKTLTAAGVFSGPEWSRWCAPSQTASGAATVGAQVQSSSCGYTNWKFPIVLTSFVGCLITGFAVSLGAPFWFDLLNKFVAVRSTVKPKESQ